ncbi:class I SAM-dependent methyltransferase [Brachybacterium sp. AOP25-B2-12]|uniref:class I SAM-dependent methyltransferase n=1 Tax=Brachybacterium sp. AOP25-B2-12 TaxID=3457710 RepID=UPI004033ED89
MSDASHPAAPEPDRVDRLILEIAATEAPLSAAGAIVVVGDVTGALTDAALAAGAPVLSWSDSAHAGRGLAARHRVAFDAGALRITADDGQDAEHGGLTAAIADLVRGTAPGRERVVVLARLPRAVRAVADLGLALAAGGAGHPVALVAGGRVKHMTRAFNPALEEGFAHVHATRGSGSARCLVARGPREAADAAGTFVGTATVRVAGADRTISLRGIGDVFGGADPDRGSLLLLGALDRAWTAAGYGADPVVPAVGPSSRAAVPPADVLDLGSGNGLLTAYLAARLPHARVHGSDDHLDAVRSTRATLAASGLLRSEVTVGWDDALSARPDGSADAVLLNPPFHDGPGIDPTLVQGLLDAVARVLRPGGELWLVHNSHLRYRTEIERRVGRVVQRARDRRFTVLSAVRRG